MSVRKDDPHVGIDCLPPHIFEGIFEKIFAGLRPQR